MNTTSDRVAWIDVAKGVAMVAIIMGHLDISMVDRVVYPWHVPLFFIVAGFFLSTTGGIQEFIRKKAKSLILPFIYTALLVVITLTMKAILNGGDVMGAFLRMAASAIYGSGSTKGVTPFGISNIGAIWFLEATFWAVLFVRLFNIWIACCIALISCISAHYVWLPFNLQAGGLGAFYVYIGYVLYQKTNLLKVVNKPLLAAGVVSFFAFCIINPQFFLVKNICSFSSVLASVLIVYSLLVSIKRLSENLVARAVGSVIGKNTLVILCLHSFQLKCFSWDSLWLMMPCAKWSGFRLPIYIIFLLICNFIYLSAGVVAVNKIKDCLLKNNIRKAKHE